MVGSSLRMSKKVKAQAGSVINKGNPPNITSVLIPININSEM